MIDWAHRRKVITAKPTLSAPSKPGFTALVGGNATQGKPTEKQAPGSAAVNPSDPPTTEPPNADPLKVDW